MWSLIVTLGKWAAGFLTGGSLEKILDVINTHMDDEVKKEELKADVTQTWIKAQANLLVGRTWWFQLFLILPMSVHWAAINWVSTFPQWGWTVYALPAPFDQYEGWIISALFMIDGSKAILGRWSK